MVDFKILVRTTCKSCNKKFRSSVPDEINITPRNCKNIKITIEELRNNVEKTVLDMNNLPVGKLELKNFEFDIAHSCGNSNKYSVSDLEFLPV